MPRNKNIHILFPFDELNAAAFQNAGIYCLKQNPEFEGCKFIVHGPIEFKDLYFHADKFVPIDPLPYSDYREVMNFSYASFFKNNSNVFFNLAVIKYLVRIVWKLHSIKANMLNILPVSIYHQLPFAIKCAGRQRKYLFNTGIYKKIKKIITKEDGDAGVFMGTAMYFDFLNCRKLRAHNEGLNFQKSFLCLERLIESSAFLSVSEISKRARDTVLSIDKNSFRQYKLIQYFIEERSKVILLRSRNKRVAKDHNAPEEMLSQHVSQLLSSGFSVINFGVPCMPLGLSHLNYIEVSCSLPPILSMDLASQADFIITTASADLFTGWATGQETCAGQA